MATLVQDHCNNQYIREYGYKLKSGKFKRFRFSPIQSFEKLLKYIETYNTNKGQFITVYGFEKFDKVIDYSTAIIDRVYFDFDSEQDISQAVKEAEIVTQFLEAHDIYPVSYFSGGKGIAMYIFFDPVELDRKYKSKTLKAFSELIVKDIKKDLGITLTTMDTSVWGDIARMSRIPDTCHSSGLYCIPLYNDELDFDYIEGIATEPRPEYDLKGVINTAIKNNSTMPIILTNLLKQVLFSEAEELKIKEERKEQFKNKKNQKNKDGWYSKDDVQRAREYPLSDLLGTKSKYAQCPLHNDNIKSMTIDHKKNLWYCHACVTGGSSIDYIMQDKNLVWKDAVGYILGL